MLAIVISVGATVGLVRVMHARTLRLAHLGADGPIKPPPSTDLAERVLGLTGVGFVFLLAFALGNFWGTNQDVRQAVQDEAAGLSRATVAAGMVPPAARDPLLAALTDYGTSVADREWPPLQRSDQEGAMAAHEAASTQVLEATAAAAALTGAGGTSADYAWDSLASAIDAMLIAGTERIAQAPSSPAPPVLLLIFVLAISNLALTAAFLPTVRGPNVFLMAVMAAITAIMLFVVVEASNPFVGGGAVQVPQVMVQQ